MNADRKDARFQTPKGLAGSHYEKMIRDKEATLGLLGASDTKVRIAAILICESEWHCSNHPDVVSACCEIAVSQSQDSVRICAIDALGHALSATQTLDASQLLARLVLDGTNTCELRTRAYWALREIQFGSADVDFDTFLKGTISLVKWILKSRPGEFSESDIKSNLMPKGRFPEDFWDSADEIDWKFVKKFAPK